MHSNKSSVLLLALAISASCVVATPHLQFLDGIFDSIPQTGLHIISGFVNATRNGTAIAGEFLDSIRNSSAQYTHETIEFAHKIADAVHRAASEAIVDFSVTLQASIDIVHQHVGLVRNILQQKALKDALATLQTVTAVVNDLEVAVHNLNDQLDEKKQEYSAIIQVKWSLWTDDQLNRVDELTNGVGNEEAEEIMNELVSRYSGYLHSCLEELQAQQATYEQNVQEAIVKYHNATNKLTAQVKLCAQFNLNYLSCRNGINTELRALDSAPAELLTLKLQGIRLLAIGLNANGCVGQTLADHELEKASVELKLDEIIRQYQEQQDGETTTIS